MYVMEKVSQMGGFHLMEIMTLNGATAIQSTYHQRITKMELFYCDNCDTLATVEIIGEQLKIAQCNCVRTKGI